MWEIDVAGKAKMRMPKMYSSKRTGTVSVANGRKWHGAPVYGSCVDVENEAEKKMQKMYSSKRTRTVSP